MAIPIINIIHNSERLDRLKTLEYELENQGIKDWNKWDAIYDVKGAHIGINAAHKQIVRWAKEQGLPEVLIGEDDLKFTDKGAFDYFISNKPLDYDLYLCGIFCGQINDNNLTKEFTGMTLYFVNERFYDTYLSLDPNKHIDAALANNGKYVVSNPFVAVQYNGFSDNTKTYCNFDAILQRRKLFNIV
jgi:hypothetical protein